MAIRVKREPGSAGASLEGTGAMQQRICFVCGSGGAAYPLSYRPRERGSYFPFLEQHDVPHGARRPKEDGVVVACMLCFSFLNQQWELYEKNRTPHAKRLYWLKRADNGHYIGAEMSLQGDYASQVIGVSPEPGSGQHGHCGAQVTRPARVPPQHHNSRGASTPHANEEYFRPDSNALYPSAPTDHEDGYRSPAMLLDLRGGKEPGVRTSGASPRSSKSRDAGNELLGHGSRKPEFPFAHSAPNGALDLSMPDKNAASEACYLCGDEVLRTTLVSVYAKPITNCPFFPSLMLHPRPSRSRPMDQSGCVQACAPCYQHLLQQWDTFQRQNVSHAERRYQLWKRGGGGTSAALKAPSPPVTPQPLPDFVCFLCGKALPWNLRHVLHAGANPEGEPPLHFLERVKPARGAAPLSTSGQALACSVCYSAVHRQRHAYLDSLRSSILEEPPPQPQLRGSGSHHKTVHNPREYEPPASSSAGACLTCYVCRQRAPRQHMKFAEALPDKETGQGFFPAVAPDDGDGFPVCALCHGTLVSQWNVFEEDRVPYHQRRYHLPQQQTEPVVRKISTASRPGSTGGVHHEMALRIRVPSPEQDAMHALPQHGGATLLTTVSTASDSPASMISVGQHSTSRGAAIGNALDLSGPGRGVPRPGVSSSPAALSKAPANPSSACAAVCYVCGLPAHGVRTYAVRTYPPKSPAGDAEPTAAPLQAFFPFLTQQPAPQEADPPAEDGTVLACTFCYHGLIMQWASHEATRGGHGAWQRVYNCHDYVCYVCGVTTYRKRVKAISVADFPFLVVHPRPPGGLVLDGGDGVTVCLMCYETLSSQWNDFERMKVPLELRKYNWIAAPPPPEEDEPTPTITGVPLQVNGESPSDYRKPIVIDDDDVSLPTPGRRVSRQETPPQQQMTASGHSKPPPLTPGGPQSNCSQKPSTRCATSASSSAAPPLSQMSPNSSSHARTTASFAAALRKLAEQATEPGDKDLSPVSPATSPCPTSAPKRIPSSLVHSSSHPPPSNFSSPPVAPTGAPAPAHGGFIDGRKGLDRSSSNQLRDPTKGGYEEARKSGSHTNHRPHVDMSREDGGVGRGSAPSYGDARMSPAKGILQGPQAADGMGSKGGGTSSGYYGEQLGREEHAFMANGLASSQQLQHLRSRQSSSGSTSIPRMENPPPPPPPSHLSAAGSGFHPYRSPPEDARLGLPQHVPATYEQTSPYGYHPAAFLPHHMAPHHSFRLDEQPLYLERYGLMRSPLFPLPHPGLTPHHSMPFMTGARYAPELLPHPLSLVSPTSHLLAQERIKLEEQHQRREIELEMYQEQERRRERDREREREKEWERENANEAMMMAARGQQQQQEGAGGKGYQKGASSWSHPMRSESPARTGVIGSITQGTPRDLVIHTSSAPLPLPQQPPSGSPSPSAATGPHLPKPPSTHPSWSNSHYFPYATREPHSEPNDGHHPAGNESGPSKLYPTMAHLLDRSSPSSDRERPPRGVRETADRSSSSLLSFLPHSKPRASSPNQPQHPLAAPLPDRTSGGGRQPATAGRRASVIAEAPAPHNGCGVEPRPKAVRNHSITGITVDVEDPSGSNIPWCSRFSPSSAAPALLPVTAEGFAAAVPASPREIRPTPGGVANGPKSKLDLAAERAKLKSGDEASDDEDDAQEGKWARLLVIASGPPLSLDASREKLSFFKYFNLTTQKKKREIELDIYVRRHRRLREPALQPLDHVPSSATSNSTPWFLSHSINANKYSSEELCRAPDLVEKVHFLRNLELTPMPRSKKEEHEQFLQAVIDEKIRRNGHTHPTRFKVNPSFRNDDHRALGSSNSEFKDLVNKGTKRKCVENEIPSAGSSGEVAPAKRVKSLLANSRKKIANLPAKRPSDATGGQSLLPIVSGPIIKQAREQSENNMMLGNSDIARTESVTAPIPSSSSLNAALPPPPPPPKMYGQDFAQEFHESVLLQTQLKSKAAMSKKGELLSDRIAATDVVSGSSSSSSEAARPQTRVDASSSSSSSSSSPSHATSHSGSHASQKTHPYLHHHHHHHLKWPGIEVLMEAYERHEQEQTLEKEVLSEQCLRLKAQKRELTKMADKLGQSMANLVHIKKDLDEERLCHHQAIDNLKNVLKRLQTRFSNATPLLGPS